METAAITPRLLAVYCTPSVPVLFPVIAPLSSLIPPTFPPLSHPETTEITRRSLRSPPRFLLRRRRTGEPAPPLCGPSFSPCPGASHGTLTPLFRAVDRRHGRPSDLAVAEVSPSASCRRPELHRISPTTPSSSPRHPDRRRHLLVAGGSPEHLAAVFPKIGRAHV